ncbi:hypothetical protein [Phocaeicola faecalis]
MRKVTLSEYNSIPDDYRGIWTVERWDLPNWAEIREQYMGKRTMMVYDKGTCLLVEGLGFEIVDDSAWKKPDEVKKEISEHYLNFYSKQVIEPHYADCIIRWYDTLETEEARIALAMDSNNEKDDEIFFYCDSINDLKSLTNKGKEDFTIAGCLGFGRYAELLQTS